MVGEKEQALEAMDRAIAADGDFTPAYLERVRLRIDDYEDMRHGSRGGGKPETPEAKALLRDVLDERGIRESIEMHEVRTREEAVELAFPGSPTIRIDGRDVDPTGAEYPPELTCRIYRLPGGRISPFPSRQLLEEALA